MTALLHVAQESAPSALVVMNMISANAEQQSYGMVQREKLNETNKDAWSVAKALPSVSTGSSLGDVNQLPISKIINALAAEKPIMVPNSALADRRTKPITTYKFAAWSKELSKYDLVKKYPNLVEGIVHGFNLRIPTISQTYTPNNHMSITLYRDAYIENVSKEFQAGQYFRPYSQSEVEDLIGPFQSSPLSC